MAAPAAVRAVRQVILAFLVRLENLVTIPKARQESHNKENAGAGDLLLADSEIARIDQAFPVPDHDTPVPDQDTPLAMI